MSSQKQIDANRANAQLSTGPKSITGRAKSRLNALRDGITGQVTTLSDDDRPVFEKLQAEHIAVFAPADVDELKIAHAIVWDTWRLDRLRATEMNIFALDAEPIEGETDPDIDPLLHTAMANAQTFRNESKRFELMSLYEQRLNRSLHRNRDALRTLQTTRKSKYERDKKEEMLLARLEDLKDLPYTAPATPTPNGFVFSSEEITAAAQRQRNLEASMFLLSNKSPWEKYGSTGAGSPDLFANLPYRMPPDCIPKKIHGISPESIALRKYYHPEEFEKRRR